MDPDKFPLMLKHAKRPEVMLSYLQNLSRAVEAKQIRNVELSDMKFSMSNVVDTVWKQEVCEPFFFGGKYREYTGDLAEVGKLYDSINVYGLHDCIAAKKKLDKTKLVHPAVTRMKAVLDELFPLAQTVADMKPFIVKGRAPSTGPSKPVNPDKDVKTCPCCFRGIAVLDGTMAHHGYRRPGGGYQTPSCSGVRFKPFEISNEGTIWIRERTKEHLHHSQGLLKALPEIKTLPATGPRQEIIQIDRSDSRWDRTYQYRKFEIEGDISSDRNSIREYDLRLKDWKPADVASPTPLPDVPSLGNVPTAPAQTAPEGLRH
jgi:hypothetical protein